MLQKTFTITAAFILIIFATSFTHQEVKQSIKRGKEVYANYCVSCHADDGKGLPDVNPPVANADYLKKSTATLINILLKGQEGEILVNKKKYNAVMPAQDYLDDTQIADVLNYIKNSWGNKIPGVITPTMVKAARK
jgi:mono/diheme cytochrome c family protein